MHQTLPKKKLYCLATYDGAGRIIGVSNPATYIELWNNPKIGKVSKSGIQVKLQKHATVKRLLLNAQVDIAAAIEGYKAKADDFLCIRKRHIDLMVNAIT